MQLTNLIGTLLNISAIFAGKDHFGCELDNETGQPDGWKSTEISLDIVIVLDTSEAMGDVALTDASIMVDSLIGSEEEDILITDPSAEIFTRIGVIAVADEVQVLHKLNLTKPDTVQGKVKVSRGVAEMDFEKRVAFQAAHTMFSDGLNERPDRSNTRQVIYIITYSEPKHYLHIAEEFKLSDGIVIVDQFIYEYDDELPILEKLASDGYFLTNSDDNYMHIIQLFCKASNSRIDDVKERQLPSITALLTSLIATIQRIWRIIE